ncbi:hypothetical protein HB371_18885 [Acinetobacter baumannii]|uniref:hypothetical protein n=1 Tax=Acinetobacter baumannii TaxID=470 RepID=UPI0014597BB9|nr:hypothetical protein [Acinetobacter baumannii]NLZ24032.1 hypothetical protein [Acinetobacter baumannii]
MKNTGIYVNSHIGLGTSQQWSIQLLDKLCNMNLDDLDKPQIYSKTFSGFA